MSAAVVDGVAVVVVEVVLPAVGAVVVLDVVVDGADVLVPVVVGVLVVRVADGGGVVVVVRCGLAAATDCRTCPIDDTYRSITPCAV